MAVRSYRWEDSRCDLGLLVDLALPGVDFPPKLFLGAFVCRGVLDGPAPDRRRTCFVCAISAGVVLFLELA